MRSLPIRRVRLWSHSGRIQPKRAAVFASALASALAPDAMVIDRDGSSLCFDGIHLRTLSLTALPRRVSWGWLSRIATWREPLLLSLHLEPQDSAQVVRQFSTQLTMLHSSRLFAEGKGKLPDPERAQAIADKEALVTRLERGDDRLFRVGLYAAVQGPTREVLESRTRRLEGAFGQARMQTRRATFEQAVGLETVLPTGYDTLGVAHTLDATTLATMFPFGAPSLCMPDGIWYGRSLQTNSPLIVDPFHVGFTNANGVIMGTSGGGKSVTAKVEILRALPRGVQCLVIDPGEAGEYAALARAVGGQVVRLSAGSRDHLNPLDLPSMSTAAGEETHDMLGEHVADLLRLLEVLVAGDGEHLSPTEKGHLEAALFACYQTAGITRDRASHRRPAPTLPDLYTTLTEGSDPFGLAGRLARYSSGALSGLFSGRTTVALDSPLTVFDLRGLDDGDLRAATMHLVTQHVWSTVRRAMRPRALFVDEAHLVCKRRESGAFLESVAKRARKHGLRVMPITQDPADFLSTDAGRAILVNSAMAFLFRCEEVALEALAATTTLSAAERAYLQGCPPGRGLLLCQHPTAFGQRLRLPCEILVSAAQRSLVFTTPDTRWDDSSASGTDTDGGSMVGRQGELV